MGVQINGDTGNISATKADYSGNVTIGGTLTYEDVTNIDSVGLVTARSGIEVGARPGVAASISVDGNAIFSGITTVGGDVKVGSGITLSPDGNIFATGISTFGSKLGIGGITPSNALDVQGGTSNTAIVARSTDAKAQISLLDNSTTSVGSVVIGAEGDDLFFTSGSSGTERLRINSAGNVRIGEGQANADLDVYGAGNQVIHIGSTNAGGASLVLDGDSNGDGSGADYAYIQHDSSGNLNIVATNPGDDSQMIFNTGGGSENARFLRSGSHGHMYINTTSQVSNAMLSLTGNGTCVIGSKVTADNNQDHISFRNPNGEVGTVSTNGSNTSFNTSSDYRLKENEVTISDAISKVKQLKPYTFNFKADSSTKIDGFFAHEAQEVAPYAVSGEKDAEKMQSMDYGKLTPLLTAALQEAISEIETLKTEVAALKSQLNN